MPAREQAKTSRLRGRSAVRSGILTGLSFAFLSLSGALAGAVLAHKFGRNVQTDGFMAAYAVYLVLVLGAQAFRMVVVPDLTRAVAVGRLGDELRAYVLSFLVLAVPVCVAVWLFSGWFGELVTGRLPHESAQVASAALVWLVPAAFGQLLASLAASALAARDSYATPAAGFALGGATGLLGFVLLADGHGIVSLAWSLAAGSAVALALPAAELLVRYRRVGGWGARLELRRRLWKLAHGAAVPLAVQALYLMALRFAAGTGTGNVTSLSYAYLLAAMFTSVTAFSLSLISTAPLTRRGVDPDSAAQHVVHSAWISLALVGAAAGVVALLGGRIVTAALGDAYAGGVGAQLGRLVVYMSPWMVASAAFSITFPLMFVMGRTRLLIPLALAAVAIDVPISAAGRAWGGLTGVVVALGVSTLLLILGLMAALSSRMLARTAIGLGRLSLLVGVAAAAAFGAPRLVLGAVPAAAVGIALYSLLLLALRHHGLREAWHYVRALH